MTRVQRTIVGLLTACAVLLALNLIAGGPGLEAQAVAQGKQQNQYDDYDDYDDNDDDNDGGALQAVAFQLRQDGFNTALYRLWSDGTVERNEKPFLSGPCLPIEWCGWQVVPE